MQTGRSMIPPQYDLKQWLTHCHHTLARHGVTRKEGLTSHGLRHQYANDRYEELTGEASPVRGGGPVDGDEHRRAQWEVSARLGHARPAITQAYYGNARLGPGQIAPGEDRKTAQAERRVQRQLLAARVSAHLGERLDGNGPVSPGSVQLRQRFLDQVITVLAQRGCPPVSYTHLDVYKRQGLGFTGDLFYRSDKAGVWNSMKTSGFPQGNRL